MSAKRVLENRCKEAGERIAAWLNSKHAKHPVTQLIELTQTMLHAYEHSKLPFTLHVFKQYQAKINAIARRYPAVRLIQGLSGRRSEKSGFSPWRGYFPLWAVDSAKQIPFQIVNDVGTLAESGDLWRIRRCDLPECKRAFFARVHHQKFHAYACKRKWRTSQPGFKQDRAKYQRERYRKQFSSTRRRKP